VAEDLVDQFSKKKNDYMTTKKKLSQLSGSMNLGGIEEEHVFYPPGSDLKDFQTFTMGRGTKLEKTFIV